MITYPGKIPNPEMQDWFSNQASKAGFVPATPKADFNPCLKLYGAGPIGKRCKECSLFIRHQMSRTYFKCKLRGVTHGPGTDHKANWPACGKFQAL